MGSPCNGLRGSYELRPFEPDMGNASAGIYKKAGTGIVYPVRSFVWPIRVIGFGMSGGIALNRSNRVSGNRLNRLLPWITTLGLLGLWEACVWLFEIPLYVLPAPTQVVAALIREAGILFDHSLVTVAEALAGMGIALVLSVVLGIMMDAFPAFKQSIYPVLVVTQTVPMIVLAPIFIIYMGFGAAPKILTVVLMCFFPVAVSFTDGMAQVSPAYQNLLRAYGAKRVQIYTLAKIPAALPTLLSGLKVAATYSISGAVVGEWIASRAGLGYYLLRVKNGYMLDKVFACVVVIILLSLLMNGLIRLIQRFCAPYMNDTNGKRGYAK